MFDFSNLDPILEAMIMTLKVLAPMTKTDLDDQVLEFLEWLYADRDAKQILLSTSCEDCDLANSQDFPVEAEEQINRWCKESGYQGSSVAAKVDWIKTITKIIEIWKLISIFLGPVEEPKKEEVPTKE